MEVKKKEKKKNHHHHHHAVDVHALPVSPDQQPGDDHHDDGKRRISWCAAAAIFCAATAFVISLFILVAALTLFIPHDPTITLVSVDVESYTPSVTFLPAGDVVRVNITLDLDLLVHNPNREKFEHEPGTTQFRYRGGVVGDAEVAAGKIPKRGSAHVKCKVTVVGSGFAGRLDQLLEDVKEGTVRFDASSKIVGKVVLLGFIRRRCVAASECHIDVAVRPPLLRVVRHRCSR